MVTHVMCIPNSDSYIVSGGAKPCGCGGSWDARINKFSNNFSNGVDWSHKNCVYCGCSCNVGDEIWSESTPTDDGIVVVGYVGTGGSGSYGETNGFIAKYDYNGNVIWDHSHGDNKYQNYRSVKETLNGNFIIVGGYVDDTQTMTNEDSDFYVVKTDSNGNVIWERIFSVWSQGQEYHEQALDVVVNEQNEFIVLGSKESADNFNIWLSKIDENGNLIWEEEIDIDDLYYQKGSLTISESGIISILCTVGDELIISMYSEGVLGCTDPNACNYNPNADLDNGSCIENNCINLNTDYIFVDETPSSCTGIYQTLPMDIGIAQSQISELGVSWATNGNTCGGNPDSWLVQLSLFDSHDNEIGYSEVVSAGEGMSPNS